jgi:hypothetical protein
LLLRRLSARYHRPLVGVRLILTRRDAGRYDRALRILFLLLRHMGQLLSGCSYEFSTRREPLLHFLCHRSVKHVIDALRKIRSHDGGSRRRLLEMRHHDGGLGVPIEREEPGETFVQDAA